jgi:hypothetical protein
MMLSLVLIEGQNVSEETLRSVSLGNAKQLVVGNAYGFGVILHLAATSLADLGNALRAFAQVPRRYRRLDTGATDLTVSLRGSCGFRFPLCAFPGMRGYRNRKPDAILPGKVIALQGAAWGCALFLSSSSRTGVGHWRQPAHAKAR